MPPTLLDKPEVQAFILQQYLDEGKSCKQIQHLTGVNANAIYTFLGQQGAIRRKIRFADPIEVPAAATVTDLLQEYQLLVRSFAVSHQRDMDKMQQRVNRLETENLSLQVAVDKFIAKGDRLEEPIPHISLDNPADIAEDAALYE